MKKKVDLDLDAINSSDNGSAPSYTETLKNIADNMYRPFDRLAQKLEPPEVDFTSLDKKREEEAEIRKLTLKKLRSESKPENPTYNKEKRTIDFAGKEIKVKGESSSAICEEIFKEPNRSWSYDEILENQGGDDIDKKQISKLSRAARHINTLVAMETTIKDLLLVDSKKVLINPKYLKI